MRKEKVLVAVEITCDPPRTYHWQTPTIEKEAEYYEDWIKDFHSFIRDHRSQDPVALNVERVYKDICEFCKSEWEEDTDGSPLCCEKAVKEFEYNNK